MKKDSTETTDEERRAAYGWCPKCGVGNDAIGYAHLPTCPTLTTGWAVRRADGSVIVEIGTDITERQIWVIALGWPTAGEVKWEKEHGARAFRCKVVEV